MAVLSCKNCLAWILRFQHLPASLYVTAPPSGLLQTVHLLWDSGLSLQRNGWKQTMKHWNDKHQKSILWLCDVNIYHYYDLFNPMLFLNIFPVSKQQTIINSRYKTVSLIKELRMLHPLFIVHWKKMCVRNQYVLQCMYSTDMSLRNLDLIMDLWWEL